MKIKTYRELKKELYAKPSPLLENKFQDKMLLVWNLIHEYELYAVDRSTATLTKDEVNRRIKEIQVQLDVLVF